MVGPEGSHLITRQRQRHRQRHRPVTSPCEVATGAEPGGSEADLRDGARGGAERDGPRQGQRPHREADPAPAGGGPGPGATRRGHASARGGPWSGGLADGVPHGLGWLPLALGTAAIVAGLGSRNKGAMALALTAFAGATAAEAMRRGQIDRGKVGSNGQVGASVGKQAAERSITIGKSADDLYQRWRDPGTLRQVMAGFATVHESGGGRMHWKVEGPLGRAQEWDSETVDDRPGESIGWRSLSSAAISNEGSISFRRAPADRGTVATLHLRFDPPGAARRRRRQAPRYPAPGHGRRQGAAALQEPR